MAEEQMISIRWIFNMFKTSKLTKKAAVAIVEAMELNLKSHGRTPASPNKNLEDLKWQLSLLLWHHRLCDRTTHDAGLAIRQRAEEVLDVRQKESAASFFRFDSTSSKKMEDISLRSFRELLQRKDIGMMIDLKALRSVKNLLRLLKDFKRGERGGIDGW